MENWWFDQEFEFNIFFCFVSFRVWTNTQYNIHHFLICFVQIKKNRKNKYFFLSISPFSIGRSSFFLSSICFSLSCWHLELKSNNNHRHQRWVMPMHRCHFIKNHKNNLNIDYLQQTRTFCVHIVALPRKRCVHVIQWNSVTTNQECNKQLLNERKKKQQQQLTVKLIVYLFQIDLSILLFPNKRDSQSPGITSNIEHRTKRHCSQPYEKLNK